MACGQRLFSSLIAVLLLTAAVLPLGSGMYDSTDAVEELTGTAYSNEKEELYKFEENPPSLHETSVPSSLLQFLFCTGASSCRWRSAGLGRSTTASVSLLPSFTCSFTSPSVLSYNAYPPVTALLVSPFSCGHCDIPRKGQEVHADIFVLFVPRSLSDDNFEEEVQQSEDYWLVEFYAPWCGHCQKLAPEWKKAAKELHGVARLGAVNCDDEKSTCSKYGIKGFPTIKAFGSDKESPSDYQQVGIHPIRSVPGLANLSGASPKHVCYWLCFGNPRSMLTAGPGCQFHC